ncbi:MAG: sigma-54 dependent transcriptional regulator [Pirellulaceae bacterium]|nr:sigma-54 dependent transcriptional regulator [Pirellulaceae bacterium]
MKHGSLLLVDDDRLVLDGMSDWLRGKGFDVAEATSCREARSLIDSTPFDLVLADIRLQDGDGFDVLAHCRDRLPEATVILVTGYATAETGIEAIRAGAFDLLTKPLIDDELELAIGRALSHRRVIEENAKLKAQLDLRFGMENVVGHDHRMLKMFDMIDSVADTRATVLITGESGTGKSLIARAIHRRSGRRDKPFVISTASPSMQVKLLRVLQELEFEPVGGNKTIRVDTRVILATNEDLARAVAAGRFRQDLYYRINVINIELPPLRSRLTDIPLLAAHFLARVRQETGKKVEGFSDDAMAALQAYSWPGNVRELQNVVERAVLLGKTPTINPTDLPRDLALAAPASPKRSSGRTLKEALEVPERQIILETLQQLSWNRNATAEQLGINRTTLYKKMKRLGLMGPTPAWNLAPN